MERKKRNSTSWGTNARVGPPQQVSAGGNAAAAAAAAGGARKGTHSLEELQRWRAQKQLMEHGIEPSMVELYLTPDAFAQAFGMECDAFEALPKWRRNALKKNQGLF